LALPIFAITLFVSAFLLFLVQPMIGKLILPKLGGTPQVWNTCMVFFQSVLLLGYAYTHSLSTRLKLRQQLMVHCALLVVPIGLIIWQPFYSTVYEWEPPTGGNPIPQTLMLLATLVGIPFFVVSTTAPLLQKWFAYSGDPAAKDPYFLYGASNLGSLLSLFFYPFLIEPFAALPIQSDIWLYGYIALALMVGYCAYLVSTMAPPDEQIEAEAAQAAAAGEITEPPPAMVPEAASPDTPPAAEPAPSAAAQTAVRPGPGAGGRAQRHKKGAKPAAPGAPAAAPDEDKSVAIEMPAAHREHTGATAEMTNWRRLRWVLLAAVPSSLMLGVTSYISTDLSPFPLVWIGALALYLLSFILVYMKFWTGTEVGLLSGLGFLSNRDRPQAGVTWHDATICALQPLGIVVLCFLIVHGGFGFGYAALAWAGFFACALACHGELAVDRPSTKHLTEYFLLMSVGGAIGGMFNGIFAPILFQKGVIEFHIAVVIACVVRPQYIPSGWFDDLVMNAFPGLQAWFKNQGDEMAKSMGREAPRSTYLFSSLMDIVFGVFVLSISYYLAKTFGLGRMTEALESAVRFFGLTTNWQVSMLQSILVYFIPLIFCFFFAGRPLRLGLAVTGLMIGNVYMLQYDDGRVLESRRTYFGQLRVRMGGEEVSDPDENDLFRDRDKDVELPEELRQGGSLHAPPYRFTYLMHGTTDHGRNYFYPEDERHKDKYQKHRVNLSRLATTYYHRYGPVGFALEQYNWFASGALLRHPTEREDPKNAKSPYRLLAPTKLPKDWRDITPGRQNDFTGDARLPASIVASAFGAAMNGGGAILEPVLAPWSEPPIATIGLGTGTMASYSRPFGFMTYYEIDDVIRGFSLPESGEQAHFTYLQQAIRRGVNLEVIMGDARQSLEPKREPKNKFNSFVFRGEFKLGNEARAYSRITYNARGDQQIRSIAPNREKFYKVINVDAFSSDAIPIHLVTKQAIEIYLGKLADDGVLCVHTSNRHMDLVAPVARIAMELDKIAAAEGKPRINVRVGKDSSKDDKKPPYMGHTSSEYVMIYRGEFFAKYLDTLAAKKREFIKNRSDAAKAGKNPEERKKFISDAEAEGKLMLYPVLYDRENNRSYDGLARAGWQILNADVHWYNPFEEHKLWDGKKHLDRPITMQDSLWTDDYSYIIGVLRGFPLSRAP